MLGDRLCWLMVCLMRRETCGHGTPFTLRLPAAVTGALLTQVPGVPRRHEEVLLTGLVVAIASGATGADEPRHAVLIDVEGHGREEIIPDVDLSRTVGWFTNLYPVRLDFGSVDVEEAMAGGAALGRALKLIKEQLRAVPDHGLGYGLLRYLNPQTAAQLAGLRGRDLASTTGPLRGAGGDGLGQRCRGRCAWRRWRSGDAACSCAGGQCADARWPRRGHAKRQLDLGAGVDLG